MWRKCVWRRCRSWICIAGVQKKGLIPNPHLKRVMELHDDLICLMWEKLPLYNPARRPSKQWVKTRIQKNGGISSGGCSKPKKKLISSTNEHHLPTNELLLILPPRSCEEPYDPHPKTLPKHTNTTNSNTSCKVPRKRKLPTKMT